MHTLSVVVTILFSVFTTTVMSYISMATPIGPWMEATLVLLGTLIFRGIMRASTPMQQNAAIGICAASGALGGIIATACAFSFPTLFFLDAPLFTEWLAHPVYFAAVMALLVLAAGSLAFAIVSVVEKRFLSEPDMSFPVGTMVYKMIAAQNQMRKALQLMVGAVSAVVVTGAQYVIRALPNIVTLVPGFSQGVFSVPAIRVQLDTLPMLWAIGFVTGHVIAVPLLVGMLSKIMIVDPMHQVFFPALSSGNFVLAFCSGMVLQGALMSFIDLPKTLFLLVKRSLAASQGAGFFAQFINTRARNLTAIGGAVLLAVLLCVFLKWFNFSMLAAVYLIIFTLVCTYQLLIIGGKAGIAPLGRFATFVMVPGLIIFGYSATQVTIVATFVELCGGIAVDVMFGRKMAQLAHIDRTTIQKYQLLGLLVSACSIGVIFWFLISHFGLGTTQLFAQRAQSRALLINAYSFNWFVVIIGAVFSFALKYCKVNAVLVLGGLLMPFDYSLPLVLGGLSTYLVKDTEAQYPFWSGVFAASSILMVIKTLI